MHLAIIETGAPPDALSARYPGYGAKMERMLAPIAPFLSFSRWRVFDGGPFPAVAAFDAMLMTGSAAGVYDGHDWIARLKILINEAAAARKPQVGICFGHQAMAEAFGGRVARSDKGWGVGLHRYTVETPAPWMEPPQREIACLVSHQDQVLEAPPSARRHAGSAFCPHGVLSYDHAPAVSFQMHPEFEADFAAELYGARRNRLGDALADDAIASLSGASDRSVIARWIAQFLRVHA